MDIKIIKGSRTRQTKRYEGGSSNGEVFKTGYQQYADAEGTDVDAQCSPQVRAQ